MLERLLGKVSDSMLLTGVDIYAAGLSIDHCLRRNADYASLRDVVDELKRGFAQPSRKKKEENAPAEVAVPAPVITQPAPAEAPSTIEAPPAAAVLHQRPGGVCVTYPAKPKGISATVPGQGTDILYPNDLLHAPGS